MTIDQVPGGEIPKQDKMAMMALYRSTGWYVKSFHTNNYNTWELA